MLPQSRDATPVRTVGAVPRASESGVQAWQIALGAVIAVALAVVAVLRTLRQRNRAALYARYNRMRVERGMPPLTPRQIDFIGPHRRSWGGP